VPGPASTRSAGQILAHGRVHPLPGTAEPAPAIAIRDGHVLATGGTDAMRALLPDAPVTDLGGAAVLPAFHDSHTHFHRAAVLRHLFLDFETLRPATIADVVAHVRARAADLPPGAWIQGDSLTAAALAEGRLPDRHALDAATTAHPVVLRGIGKHVVVANSAALAAAGIGRDTADPPGGRIERDPDGTPNGILHERAKLRLDTSAPDTAIPPVERSLRLAALRAGIDALHREGIGTIGEMVRLTEEADDLAALAAEDALGVRVGIHYRVHEGEIRLPWLAGLGIRRVPGDDRIRVLGAKVSIDGWCIFRNAAVHRPYRGEPGNTGILRIDPDALTRLVGDANRQGLGIALHAVGARAIDAALDAFAAAGTPTAGPWRLEHAHLDLDAPRIARIRALGLVVSAQPAFLPAYRADWEAGLEPERVEALMPLASVRAAGIPVIINSDRPSGPAGPLRAIAGAVTRRAGDRTIGAAEALPLADAWYAHTRAAALAMDDPRGGILAPGARADLVVLAEDPFLRGGDDLPPVAATMLDGRWAWDGEGRFR